MTWFLVTSNFPFTVELHFDLNWPYLDMMLGSVSVQIDMLHPNGRLDALTILT